MRDTTMNGDAAICWLAERAKPMEEELAELVAINSFTDNVEGGRKVGEALRARTFAIAGLAQDVRPSTRYA
ncbi:MAG TPA: hypothetical protein VF316_00545, partial [Polyangiaceae bacterium]